MKVKLLYFLFKKFSFFFLLLVILSAGVINSPQLLCLSGIGPSEDLKKLKIPIVYENNNVGKNYHDHILFPVGFTLKSKIDFSLEVTINF